MNELFFLYWPTIIAAAICAATLSTLGALLANRRAEVQILPVSQAATWGVSLGILWAKLVSGDGHLEHTVAPFVFGLGFAALGFSLTSWLTRRSQSKTPVHLASFALFWALTQITSGIFPAIEHHASALFFGDVVTLTKNESYFFAILASLSCTYLGWNWRRQAERAFVVSILEEPLRLRNSLDLGFYFCALLLVCLSVQFLGLLFTLASLYLPTAIYSFSARPGAGRHLARVAGSAFFAAGTAFILSLAEPRLLTTPLIALFLAILPLGHLAAERALFRCK